MALTKYSYAVVSLSYPGPIPWTHIQLKCFAVFESSSSQTSQGVEHGQKFKVLQDLSTLVLLQADLSGSTNLCRKNTTFNSSVTLYATIMQLRRLLAFLVRRDKH